LVQSNRNKNSSYSSQIYFFENIKTEFDYFHEAPIIITRLVQLILIVLQIRR